MKLTKGMLVEVEGIWYVVVEIRWNICKEVILCCICDNANNIYSWDIDKIDGYLTLEEIGNLGYGEPERGVLCDREIPYKVITEVLAGRHDGRFDHWFSDGSEEM